MAIVPAPRTWGATEAATAAKFNADIRDGYNFLLAPPRCALRKGAIQVIPDNTHTALTWDTEEIDSDNGHSTVTNPSRYTAQTAGWYYLAASCSFFMLNSAGFVGIYFIKNSDTSTRQNRSDVCSTHTSGIADLLAALFSTGFMFLAVGDYVEVGVYQNSGFAVDTGPIGIPRFDIRWVHT